MDDDANTQRELFFLEFVTLLIDTVATQPTIDPRRLGEGNSGLSHDDLSDIMCILHPISLPAIRSAARTLATNPQATVDYEGYAPTRQLNNASKALEQLATQDLTACDLALRFSQTTKDPLSGFVFGRNRQRCDFILLDECGSHGSSRLSNVHFRIYVNDHGAIMLEDQSTNGTAVGGVLLRGKDKENGQNFRHTLEHGSVIAIAMGSADVASDFKWIVRFPRRDELAELLYSDNLASHLDNITRLKLKTVRPTLGAGKPVCRVVLCSNYLLILE